MVTLDVKASTSELKYIEASEKSPMGGGHYGA
jgi:hypothetical protein